MVNVIKDHHWIPATDALSLLSYLGLLVLPVDIGDGQAVQLPHRGEDGDGELVALVSKQVRKVGAEQDDAVGEIPVILA